MRLYIVYSICIVIFSAITSHAQQEQKARSGLVVLDLTTEFHQVALGKYNQTELSVTTILKDVDFFRGSLTGHYVARKTNGAWLVGNYRTKVEPTMLDTGVVPTNSVEASIAHNGKLIVWVTREKQRSRLILMDVITRTSCQILAKTGDLCCPSWSPDDRKIAYFSGQLGAQRHKDFSLHSLDIPEKGKVAWEEVEWFEKEIAPQSLPSIIKWPLGPPKWSPNGLWLLFEACYTKDKPFVTQYIVKNDGTDMKPAPGMIPSAWTRDSKGIYTVFERKNRYIPAIVDIETSEEKHDRLIPVIPEGLLMFDWEPEGDFLVTMNLPHLVLLNIRTGQQRLLHKCTTTCRILWGEITNE